MEHDPEERINLAAELPHRSATLAAKLALWNREAHSNASPCHA